jgi:hypothetical protein
MLEKDEAIKLARESLEKELAHYLDKLWKLFSWSSTILLSIIAGIYALRFRERPVSLSSNNKVSFVLAVAVLGFFAIVQIKVVLGFETKTRNKLDECDKALGIPYERLRPDMGDMSKYFFYLSILIALTAAAVYSIICDK